MHVAVAYPAEADHVYRSAQVPLQRSVAAPFVVCEQKARGVVRAGPAENDSQPVGLAALWGSLPRREP